MTKVSKGTGLVRLLTLVVGVAMVALFGAVGTAAPGTAAPSNKQTVQVRGTSADGSKFNGQFTVDNFGQPTATSNGQPVANGNLTGTLIHPGQGQGAQQVSQPAALPVNLAQTTGSCQILNLVLGPVDLNLLGLVVHLDTVHLNITAQQGAGNLLGNLLCDVANLLNNNPLSNLTGLLGQLNQILAAL